MTKHKRFRPRTLHDRLFKEFLRRFLPEFMQLFFPEKATLLNFATLRFLDKEQIINLPDQALRITDIVAEVQTWAGETETVLVHVEVEGRDKSSLPRRMSEYYALLRVLLRKPVLPLALVLLSNAGGLTWKEYTEELFGEKLLHFRYGQVGIRDLLGAAYLARQEPVAATLALLMKTPGLTKAAVKLAAMQSVVASNMSDGNKLYLLEVMNTYAPTAELYDAREEIMQKLLETEMTWGEKLREEGREEGELLGERKMLLHLLKLMFGPLPDDLVQRLQAINDETVLYALSQQLLKAQSLDEIVIPAVQTNGTNHSHN